MITTKRPKVVFIGAGNLATNLALALHNAGCKILQVYSRSIDSAKILADKVESMHTTSSNEITPNADIFFICIPDKAIQPLIDQLRDLKGVVVHTSGSTDITILSKFRNYGVFYPFQSFSKNRIISFDDIPICINANSSKTYKVLCTLASLISKKVVPMDSKTLTWLHLSGVIANNFTNHLIAISQQLSIDKGFNFNLLKPLVMETVQKAFNGNPDDAQTGPAIRFDQTTIDLHIEKLNEYSPELANIYKELTLSIQSRVIKK